MWTCGSLFRVSTRTVTITYVTGVYFTNLRSDVFSSGIWSDLSIIEDPELQQLAQSLPSLVLQGKAVSTVKKYSGAYNRWRKWASTKPEISTTLPPLPIHISLYLSFLAQTAKTSAPVVEAVSAISWVNQIATVEDTTTHPLVVQVLAGIKRKLACATTKKEPITPEILSTLVTKCGQQDASLSDIRTLSVCLLGFAGFFRFDELAKIRESDIAMYKEYMEIFIESSKTDHAAQGWCLGSHCTYRYTTLSCCYAGTLHAHG